MSLKHILTSDILKSVKGSSNVELVDAYTNSLSFKHAPLKPKSTVLRPINSWFSQERC